VTGAEAGGSAALSAIPRAAGGELSAIPKAVGVSMAMVVESTVKNVAAVGIRISWHVR
jgi:hypothetical protein